MTAVHFTTGYEANTASKHIEIRPCTDNIMYDRFEVFNENFTVRFRLRFSYTKNYGYM